MMDETTFPFAGAFARQLPGLRSSSAIHRWARRVLLARQPWQQKDSTLLVETVDRRRQRLAEISFSLFAT
jgi:hypothetical protein